jgi:hypothetical protein
MFYVLIFSSFKAFMFLYGHVLIKKIVYLLEDSPIKYIVPRDVIDNTIGLPEVPFAQDSLSNSNIDKLCHITTMEGLWKV